MMDMPPIKFADVGGVRLGYYDAGPEGDAAPFVLCHGWPEIAFTWRRQIQGLTQEGFRVVAPDQRGFGASDCPPQVEDYAIENLVGDIVALMDGLKIEKAVLVGHDWGGFVVWETALRHPDRVAGVASLTTPHLKRASAEPIGVLRRRMGDDFYIVRFQDPSHELDQVFGAHVDALFDYLLRRPSAGGEASPVCLDFSTILPTYDPAADLRPRLLSAEERRVVVDAFRRTGFTGGVNWYRNITRNWERTEGRDDTIRVPALMMMGEFDPFQPAATADGMERLVPNLAKHLVKGAGHWLQEERPDEVTATLLDWRRSLLARA